TWYYGPMKEITRTQTGVRLESRLLKVLKALATELDLSLGDLLEGIVLHAFEGKAPFSQGTLKKIRTLRAVYGLDLTARDSHQLREGARMSAEAADLERFQRGESDAGNFPHREHVRMAFEMLRRHDFAETAWLYSRALRLMTARVGKPEAFNQTTTIAFLSLIAERMERGGTPDFAAFVRAHP